MIECMDTRMLAVDQNRTDPNKYSYQRGYQVVQPFYQNHSSTLSKSYFPLMLDILEINVTESGFYATQSLPHVTHHFIYPRCSNYQHL